MTSAVIRSAALARRGDARIPAAMRRRPAPARLTAACRAAAPQAPGQAAAAAAARAAAAILLAAALLAGVPRAAAAEVRALLVGVSDYAHLEGRDLRGPRNDVVLLARVLTGRGVAAEAITVLAEAPRGLDPAIRTGRPTRAAILAALGELAATAGPGDSVLFYFSGHGSQAPDLDGDEGGGPDEILLPADVRGWSGRTGRVEGAIVDDELRQAVAAILARGAAFVGIIDACHSGTGFRAVAGAGEARMVDPAALGVPGERLGPAAPAAAGGAGAGGAAGAAGAGEVLAGDYVFLYAAQPDQRAWEYPFGDPADPAAWHGDFTAALVAALETAGEALSWAELAALATDAIRRTPQGRPAQTPDAEGTALEAPVIGAAAGGARRFGLAGERLEAGLLHGIEPGALLEIHAEAAGGAPLGRAVVTAVGAASARLRPEGGLVLPERGHAQLLAPGAPPPLRLSAPRRADPADGEDYAALLAALEAARGLEGLAFDQRDFDIGLLLAEGALLLTGPDGVADPAGPGSSPRLREPAALPGLLARAARAERLRRALALAERAAARRFSVGGPALRLEAERIPGEARGQDCSGAAAGPAEAGIDLAARTLEHCDAVWITLTNASGRAQDVTVLYIAADFEIVPLWPLPGISNRIEPGERARIGFRVSAPGGLALEELVILAVPAEPGRPRTDLSALAREGGAARSLAPSPLLDFLAAAVDPGRAARGFTPAAAPAAPEALTVLRTPLAVRAPGPARP